MAAASLSAATVSSGNGQGTDFRKRIQAQEVGFES